MSRTPPDPRLAALATTWGTITIAAGERGVCSCTLPTPSRRQLATGFRVLELRLPDRPPRWLREAAAHARAIAEGRDPGPCPPLHPAVVARATPFRRRVWQVLQRIPRGRTLTYAELARKAGRPRAARAAGGACGSNPLPLFIPCHRVVAADGGLGGFSSGLAWKQHLLCLERESTRCRSRGRGTARGEARGEGRR